MKKFIVVVMCFGLFFSGCSQVATDQGKEVQLKEEEQQEEGHTKLVDLPKDYPLELAKSNGDYVNLHGELFNEERMVKFLEDVSNKKSAFLRKVEYTIEGDPIITDFNFDGDKFYVVQDNTRDAFGIPEVIEKTYNNIVTYEYSERVYDVVTNLEEITEEDVEKGFDSIVLKYE